MKKTLCILLAMMILISAMAVAVSAETTITLDPNNLYEEILFEKYRKSIEPYLEIYPDVYEYQELEYHYNEQGEIDWALIYARYMPCFDPDIMCAITCGRVWELIDLHGPGYSEYDVDKQILEFVFNVDWSKYEGIKEALARAEIGRPVGDANFNGYLDIMDATQIQLVLAGLSEFNYKDDIYGYYPLSTIIMNDENLKYVSDIDRDGERTILDATAIQLKLAGLE